MKSIDQDLWHIISIGDIQTKMDFEKQNDDLKKKLAKNNEAKMVIYNA